MFYSQTYLARKGPLGTVWCAAHLQHRLRKSHYTSTDISSTVDRIMFPEVPIALRMSGHLLLGIVRIYSKKVEYLFQDCNVVLNGLRKAFASIDLNLPEDTRKAPVQSITLPDKFDLDSLDLDDEIYCDGTPDNHLRSQEEITLTDQIPFGRDHYVAISFDEDIMMMDSSHPEMVPNSDVRPMEEDIPTPPPIFEKEALNARFNNDRTPQNFQHDVDFRDADPSNQTEMLNMRFADDNISPDVPGREILRDAVPDFGLEDLPPVLPDHGENVAETNGSLDQIINEEDIISPIMEDNLVSAGQSLLFQQRSEPPPSAASPEPPEILDTHVSFSMAGDISPGLGIIRSTPPVQQPKARSRKRKQFDKATVLTNKFMKKSLEDSSDLLRKKRDAPCSALGVWKLNSILRKEQIFHQPSLTGLCMDLCDIFKGDYISSKPQMVVSEEAFPDPRIAATPVSTTDAFPEPRVPQSPAAIAEAVPEPCVAQSPVSTTDAFPEPWVPQSPAATAEAVPEPFVAQSPAPVPDLDMEIELPRNVEGDDSSNFLPEFVPSQARFTPSPLRRHDFTPATTSETRVLPTPDPAVFTGTCRSEPERPMALSEERLDLEHTGFSDIPGLMNSAEANELYFLEADNNTPTGSQGMGGVDSLSVRSRAMAQYLKRHSPINPISEGLSEDLSLNKILEGKTRKICARMFFETLVLKSNGLVDVQQEEPYGDISLKLTPTLSKAEI